MHLKALVGVSIFAGTTIAAIAQEDLLDETPKPNLADVQHLAEVISSDKSIGLLRTWKAARRNSASGGGQ